MNAIIDGRPSADGKSYALTLLRADLFKVKRVFAKFARADSETERRRLLKIICGDWMAYASIDEEIIYPSTCEMASD